MWVPVVIGAVALVMMWFELRQPGRDLPKVAGWWARTLSLNGIQIVALLGVGSLLNPWLQGSSRGFAHALGPVGGALFGDFVCTFVFYWWHRWRHESNILWRGLHQVHHSPKRLEIATSFYKHPLESTLNMIVGGAILYLVLGLDPIQASGAAVLSGWAELVYHWNVKTPHWLGYFVQRPESHCVHHEVGTMGFNYSDLPLWDMLFGTFLNPRETHFDCGFGDGEHRLVEMLIFEDVA